MTESSGKHIVIDFYSCYQEPLQTEASITEILNTAFTKINFPVPLLTHHNFNDDHVIYAISENSHITLRAYPVIGYAALDIYTFKNNINTKLLMKVLKDAFGAEKIKMTSINRGDFGKLADMKPRAKTKTTAKAKVKHTGKKVKKASSKMIKMIVNKNNKN